MSARGFSLVELLLASVITLLVLAAALVVVASARTSFAVEPATLDTVRRLRAAAGVMTVATTGAGGDDAVADGVWALGSSLPLVRPLTTLDEAPGPRFTALWTMRAQPGGRGRLVGPQPGPSGSLPLDQWSACPATGAVCGFDVGDVAVVFDGRGHSDVFSVGAVSPPLARITPRAPLSRAYDADAWVVAVRVDRFGLVGQPDGSQTLTRITSAGAREPLVDGVIDLEIVPWGRGDVPQMRDAAVGRGLATYGLHPPAADELDTDGVHPDGVHCMARRDGTGPLSTLVDLSPASELVVLSPAQLSDGPWCPTAGTPAAFDADHFRLRRLDVRLRVNVQSAEFRGPAGALFTRGGTAGRNAPRWVRDRSLVVSAVVGR